MLCQIILVCFNAVGTLTMKLNRSSFQMVTVTLLNTIRYYRLLYFFKAGAIDISGPYRFTCVDVSTTFA